MVKILGFQEAKMRSIMNFMDFCEFAQIIAEKSQADYHPKQAIKNFLGGHATDRVGNLIGSINCFIGSIAYFLIAMGFATGSNECWLLGMGIPSGSDTPLPSLPLRPGGGIAGGAAKSGKLRAFETI